MTSFSRSSADCCCSSATGGFSVFAYGFWGSLVREQLLQAIIPESDLADGDVVPLKKALSPVTRKRHLHSRRVEELLFRIDVDDVMPHDVCRGAISNGEDCERVIDEIRIRGLPRLFYPPAFLTKRQFSKKSVSSSALSECILR